MSGKELTQVRKSKARGEKDACTSLENHKTDGKGGVERKNFFLGKERPRGCSGHLSVATNTQKNGKEGSEEKRKGGAIAVLAQLNRVMSVKRKNQEQKKKKKSDRPLQNRGGNRKGGSRM